jgi:hypothetical protein
LRLPEVQQIPEVEGPDGKDVENGAKV